MQINSSNLLTLAGGARALQSYYAKNHDRQPKIDSTNQQKQYASFERLKSFSYSSNARDAMSLYKSHSANSEDSQEDAEIIGIDVYV